MNEKLSVRGIVMQRLCVDCNAPVDTTPRDGPTQHECGHLSCTGCIRHHERSCPDLWYERARRTPLTIEDRQSYSVVDGPSIIVDDHEFTQKDLIELIGRYEATVEELKYEIDDWKNKAEDLETEVNYFYGTFR